MTESVNQPESPPAQAPAGSGEAPASAAASGGGPTGAGLLGPRDAGDSNIGMILDIPVTISMELGRAKVPIRNLLQLTQGSVVELERMAGEPLDVMVNGTLIAHGEIVVVNERYGIRFTDVVSPAERVQKLK